MTIETNYLTEQSPVFGNYLKATILVGLRLSGLFIFSPVFSSTAITGRLKACLLIMMTISCSSMVGVRNTGHIDVGISAIAREVAVALVFGLSLSMIMELANTAGQVVGMQFSFTLVNLLDPNSSIETPLFSNILQLLTTTILVSSGFDRVIISAVLRTYVSVPIGGNTYHTAFTLTLIPTVGSVLLAAVQLVTPLIVATVLVEISIALVSRLSPQIPVLALTIPAKTIVGLGVLGLTLTSWSAFIEGKFSWLLDLAQHKVIETFGA